jgi:CBS domain containing-hemolysin-like protein
MSRMVGTTTARVRLVLAFVLGGPVAVLMPSLFTTMLDASSAGVLASVAVAAVASVLGHHVLVATGVPRALAPQSRATQEAPSFLAARVTDPLHHPLRPRAPGLV